MPTRYPIILVHGVAAKDHFRLISSWGRIPQVLSKHGFLVYLGNTDAWSSFAHNAKLLSHTIDQVMEKHQVSKVNIIAHSKGGIDARYLISGLNYAPKIASLTTISTPHRGSELADLIVNSKKLELPLIQQAMKALLFIYQENNPNPQKMAMGLTRKHMKLFNQQNPDSPDVYYQSFYTIMQRPTDNLAAFLTYQYIKKITGENDGVVSAWSAKWGSSHKLISGKTGGISHHDSVDIKKRPISGIDIPDEYLKIVSDLEKKGL